MRYTAKSSKPSAFRQGFSMVEVLIGFLVLTIAMASAVQLSFTLARITESNHYLNAAVNLAEGKLEELRNADFNDVVTDADAGQLDENGAAGELFTRSWEVTDDTPATGLKYVKVNIAWSQAGEDKTYQLCGVVEPGSNP